MIKHKILLVDDDAYQLRSIKLFLENREFLVDTASSGMDAVTLIEKAPEAYKIIVLDFQMDGMNGLETALKLFKINPDLYILMFSKEQDYMKVIAPVLRSGAAEFVTKTEGITICLDRLRLLCRKYDTEMLTTSQTLWTPTEDAEVIRSVGLVGASAPLAEAIRTAKKVAPKAFAVLILGETGSGKERISRIVHGDRKGKFIDISGAAIDLGTSQSLLSGHKKGSFTDAICDRVGKFVQAMDGTFFIDELDKMAMKIQEYLLRILQEMEVDVVGGQKVPINCRFVAAANRRLLQMVEEGKFLDELFFRLAKCKIFVPPLAERPDDIKPLVNMYLDAWSMQSNGEKKSFLESTLPLLERYNWPGNVRQVENVVYEACEKIQKKRIGPDDLKKLFPALFVAPQGIVGSTASLRAKVEETEKNCIIEALKGSTSIRDAAIRLESSQHKIRNVLRRHNLNAESFVGLNRVINKGVA